MTNWICSYKVKFKYIGDDGFEHTSTIKHLSYSRVHDTAERECYKQLSKQYKEVNIIRCEMVEQR